MAFCFNSDDQDILVSIAEHGILNVCHLATLHQRNPNALRRRLKDLRGAGLVQISARGFGNGPGRPEAVISLTNKAVDLLKANGMISSSARTDQITAARIECIDHELAVSNVRVQLVQMRRFLPALTIQFFSVRTPLFSDAPSVLESIHETIEQEGDPDSAVEFDPDGVLAMTHADSGKTLLSFVEVDMGTEPLTSPSRPQVGIRRKILNYQSYFHTGRYRRYQDILGCELRGFRLLMLTHGSARLNSVCRLVKETPPSDFIWVTSLETMLAAGVWAPIWIRGGRDGRLLESILGTKMPDPPPTPEELNQVSLPRRIIHRVTSLLNGPS